MESAGLLFARFAGAAGGQADSRSWALAAPMLRRAQRPSVGNIGPAPFSAADPGRLWNVLKFSDYTLPAAQNAQGSTLRLTNGTGQCNPRITNRVPLLLTAARYCLLPA
eukprot:COSAG01_NODE_159_length_23702_cov_119.507585_24_plen_109_part_00